MKNNRRDPIKVMLVWTVCFAVLAAACFMLGNAITGYRKNVLDGLQADARAINEQRDQEYARAMAEFEANNRPADTVEASWPAPKAEGWDVVDLTAFPLDNATTVSMSRAELMNGGLLLVNEWHSRPDDFNEETLVSIGNYTDGKIAVDNYNLELFPVAIDALQAALTDAAVLGYQNYMVDEAYRSWADQEALFNKYMERHSANYSGDALIERTKRDVNYPGTSEFNSGLTFTLRLYKSGDAAVNNSTYINTPEGQWLSENSWRYGLVFRFPKADYPLKGTQDKTYKTGVSVSLDAYRYVGKGHAAAMNCMGLCLEEYIEFLQEHPHIAVYEDGVLRYEIYRQYVGDGVNPVSVQITRQAQSYVPSLDNMGAVVTVFEY